MRTSIPEIQEACSWYVGFRKITPSYKQIRSVIEFLRFPHEGNTKGNMIGTMKGTHGMIVDIVTYDFYQDPKNYEGHNEGNTKDERRARQGHNTNKNVKNDTRMDKKDIVKPDIPYEEILELYHTNCPSLPKVMKLNTARKTAIRVRFNEHGLETLTTLFQKAEASDFLSGRSGKWKGANMDWLLKDSNCLKVLEGSYDNSGRGTKQTDFIYSPPPQQDKDYFGFLEDE